MILAGPRSRPLGLPLAVALAALLGGVAAYFNVLASLAVVAALAFVVLLAAPALALPVLIAGSALNRFGPQWGDTNIRLDLLVVLLVAVVLSNRIAVRTLPLAVLRSPLLLPLAAYAGMNLLSTLLFAVERIRGLKLDVEIVVAILTYLLAAAALRRRQELEVALKALWVVTVGEAAIGLLFAAAYLGHLTAYGVSEVASGLPAAYGTTWEPNVFGSFLLGNFFLLLADYIAHKRRGRYTYGLAIVMLGIIASLTRTVWIALPLGAIFFFVGTHRVRQMGRAPLVGAVAVLVLALTGLVLGTATPLGARLLDIVNLHSSSAAGRIGWFQVAIADWSRSPLFGLGTGSWNFGAVPGQPHPWLPSLFLLTLHDTGILGAAALGWLIWRFYAITIPVARATSDLSLIALGSITGFSCLLLAFQTTTGFWFAYIWIVMAVGTAAARLYRAEQCE